MNDNVYIGLCLTSRYSRLVTVAQLSGLRTGGSGLPYIDDIHLVKPAPARQGRCRDFPIVWKSLPNSP